MVNNLPPNNYLDYSMLQHNFAFFLPQNDHRFILDQLLSGG